ncbi:cell division protein SepF [Clostridium tetani]|uniref:Cell division protein SepF n=1 Tax=Clostridium tetani TaxID=1513 RepID=A0A4Q0VDZ6_CLOTA|nr:cell division protein SepF [Clostridium tetani]RXI49470.1 cell division protein SepF [Clostridium tetani]RXI68249.1 cell division protein SepF [Clostridium tetani]RXM57139.1 cell division protein SepF [Clostridium tetani]RXM71493.1 cell division protein SepF [Clostridium tetani]RXM78447.1 cell division protein SepF [Clostridium tetani]
MAGKVLNKVMGFLGLEDEYEYEEYYEDTDELENSSESAEFEPIIHSNKKQGKVVSIHSTSTPKVSIVKPKTYDEVVDICDDLKDGKIVIVNSIELDPKVGQRLVDFVSGATYSLNGTLEEIEKGIYILSPSNVEVDSELKNQLSSKGMFSWNR